VTAKRNQKVVVTEVPLPCSQKTIRLTFNTQPLLDALRRKNFDNTGRRDSENAIFAQALYDYAVAALGKEEVDKWLKEKRTQ
jgi:hypothetical protein